VLVHFTINPGENTALFYFLDELIILLIIDFGYGALKFRLLIKLLSEMMKPTRGEGA